VLYRLGDFYEMFFDDALKASKLLDITLTGRNCGIDERAPMCGIPYHALKNYLGRLLAAGEKAVICEQVSDPNNPKGMMKREVSRVITPGTNTLDELLDEKTYHYLAAIKSDKTFHSFSISLLDITTGYFEIKEIKDGTLSDLEDFLLCVLPTEIITTDDLYIASKKLNSVIIGRIVKFTSYYDYAFEYDSAVKTILNHYNVYSLDALGLNDSYSKLSICSIGGILNYLKETQKKDLSHINIPKLIKNKQEMYIDYTTRKNLELTEVLLDGNRKGSILWVIDKTRTPIGARNLRTWLLHPLQDISEINERLDAVNELINKYDTLSQIQSNLEEVKDLERLVSKISYNTITPRDCIVLKNSLKNLPLIIKDLSKFKSKLFKDLTNKYIDVSSIYNAIDKTILDNPATTLNEGGYINDNFNDELDSLRKLQNNTNEVLENFIQQQRDLTNIQSLKVGYNKVFGYYIEITKAKLTPDFVIPEGYERKQSTVNSERFINKELSSLEKEILGANERIISLENDIYTKFKAYLLENINSIKINAEVISIIDTIASFSEIAKMNNYCKPKFNTKNTIEIINGRHPVVEQISNDFVPNDTLLNTENLLTLITGPNMGGKSTYIRQNAIIVLLAHIGCFVPAESANICIVDRIFTRVGASDNLLRGQSTFMVEMLEMANIINNATNKSLLILDEVGRGTSNIDGLSIAWSIVEYIVNNIKAKTLFATHYHELCELENKLKGITNLHVLIKEEKDSIVFLYKIMPGGLNKSFGIDVAALAGIKKDVIQRAKGIMENILQQNSQSLLNNTQNNNTSIAYDQLSLFPEPENYTKIKNIFKKLNINNCTPMQALTILFEIKDLIDKD
ncbi:MAG: DNA mismatch repair protein MutS, partial [Clostridia bacterium]|nr:DNA mismatch repair protein MutS [Clostridia bacterium]